MFTSRAEHRLLLRIDNADLRLTPRGREMGLIDDASWDRFEARRTRFEENLAALERTRVRTVSGATVPVSQLLRQPEVRLAALAASGHVALSVAACSATVDIASVETAVKYEGYLRRQDQEIQRAKREGRRRIPDEFCYDGVPGLSREVIQRLSEVRPDTIGQAARIPGVTPAAAAVLACYVARFRPS